jgi:hypothetical protein
MLHLYNRQLLQMLGKMVVFPVLAHLGVNEILAERGELFLQILVERGNHFFASLHGGKSSKRFLREIYRWGGTTGWSV